MAGKRKKLMADMTVQMAAEVRTGLAARAAADAAHLVESKLTPMLQEEAHSFNNDARFQAAVEEALRTKRSVELAAVVVQQAAAEGAADGAARDAAVGGELAAAMEKAEPLQGNVVDLSKMSLAEGGADVALVVAWMRSSPGGVSRLKVDAPAACAEVRAALGELVASTDSLVDLDLMEEGGSKLNVLQLNGTEVVDVLHLQNKGLGPASAAIVAGCIRRNATVTALHLDDNRIGAEGVAALTAVLASTNVVSLSLSGNGIGADGLTAIAAVLNATELTTLNLAENCVCDVLFNFNAANEVRDGRYSGTYSVKGIAALASGLRGNRSLTALNLADNGIGDEGCVELAHALAHNRSLASLNLHMNDMGVKGANALAAVVADTRITHLDVGYNNRYASFATMLAAVVNTINPPEEARSYSTVYGDDANGTGHARSTLDSAQAWSAFKVDADQWTIMDAGKPLDLVGAVVSGRGHSCENQIVTELRLETSADASAPWVPVAGGKVFSTGVVHPHTSGAYRSVLGFGARVTAQRVRLRPVSWGAHISLRCGLMLADGEEKVALELAASGHRGDASDWAFSP